MILLKPDPFRGATLVKTAYRIDPQEVAFRGTQERPEQTIVALPSFALDALKRQQERQRGERVLAGSKWVDTRLVFTTTIGTPLDERNVRRVFKEVLEAAELPALRIHDLRHTTATLLLTQGVHPRVVMETLGHSQISLTLDTYSHVLPGLQSEAVMRRIKQNSRLKT